MLIEVLGEPPLGAVGTTVVVKAGFDLYPTGVWSPHRGAIRCSTCERSIRQDVRVTERPDPPGQTWWDWRLRPRGARNPETRGKVSLLRSRTTKNW